MFSFIKRIINNLIHKLTYIHQEPVSKVNLIILIVIDIFVLFNVFGGLTNISLWTLSPAEEFPCFSVYDKYQKAEKKGTFEFNTTTIENLIEQNKLSQNDSLKNGNRLGKVSTLCANYPQLSKAINNKETSDLKAGIDQLRNKNSSLSAKNNTLENQYDSTLLEKIAGQDRQKSINKVNADQIKSVIDGNNQQISDNKKQITDKQTKLIQHPTAQAYLQFLNNTSEYEVIKKAYKSAEFWYPNQQLLLQTLFLIPLIVIAYIWHSIANRKNQGLQALISWHLLVIFCIPLLIKFFEFIQFGNLVTAAVEIITNLLGGLIFISSYILILIIPLLGFGLIKLLQLVVFNSRIQARRRIQKVHCINCNTKLRLSDEFCYNCGFNQYTECSNCHEKTYKLTNFCSHCGHKLN
jgi:hypothetical protein